MESSAGIFAKADAQALADNLIQALGSQEASILADTLGNLEQSEYDMLHPEPE